MSRAVLALAIAGCAEGGAGIEAQVTRVIDGDTVELSTGAKVRYLMIDAPEITNGHDDCYGHNAATFNADLVLGKTVELTYDVDRQDVFGRDLAYVSVAGTDVNALMIERGFACLLHIPPNGDARFDQFTELAIAARTEKRGLWGACAPIPCT